jgi:hypothetical protein
MKEFDAHKLVNSVRCALGDAQLVQNLGAYPTREGVIAETRKRVVSLLECCEAADLRMSMLAINSLLGLFNLSENAVAESGVDAVWKTIKTVEDELPLHMYFSVEASEAKNWGAKCLFGDEVSINFPSTDFELEEYSKCVATNRYTASVFHLMRVLEIGITVLARSIGADPDNKSWETILNTIQGKLKENSVAKPEGWKETEQFYSELSAHFRNLKNAWRNYTMHVHEKYDEERTEEISVNVRAVMKQLAAKGLRE